MSYLFQYPVFVLEKIVRFEYEDLDYSQSFLQSFSISKFDNVFSFWYLSFLSPQYFNYKRHIHIDCCLDLWTIQSFLYDSFSNSRLELDEYLNTEAHTNFNYQISPRSISDHFPILNQWYHWFSFVSHIQSCTDIFTSSIFVVSL